MEHSGISELPLPSHILSARNRRMLPSLSNFRQIWLSISNALLVGDGYEKDFSPPLPLILCRPVRWVEAEKTTPGRPAMSCCVESDRWIFADSKSRVIQ